MAKVKTKSLDVVYFVSAFPNADLIYSIRSVAENLEFNSLWIYGGKPTSIVPDHYECRRDQKGATKWDRVRAMYRQVCENDEITDDFILFHDDFFVLNHISELAPEYCATLTELAKTIEYKRGISRSNYTSFLRRTEQVLKCGGYTAKAYELHKPFIFNRKKMLQILNDYPEEHCIRSIYANVYKVGGRKALDCKVPGRDDDFIEVIKTSDFISTSNISFAHGRVGVWLRDRFSKPCRYEL